MSYLIHTNELCFAHVFEAGVNNALALTRFEQMRFKCIFIGAYFWALLYFILHLEPWKGSFAGIWQNASEY